MLHHDFFFFSLCCSERDGFHLETGWPQFVKLQFPSTEYSARSPAGRDQEVGMN